LYYDVIVIKNRPKCRYKLKNEETMKNVLKRIYDFIFSQIFFTFILLVLFILVSFLSYIFWLNPEKVEEVIEIHSVPSTGAPTADLPIKKEAGNVIIAKEAEAAKESVAVVTQPKVGNPASSSILPKLKVSVPSKAPRIYVKGDENPPITRLHLLDRHKSPEEKMIDEEVRKWQRQCRRCIKIRDED
jgi:hypothetical protein